MPDLENDSYVAIVHYNGDPARIACTCRDCGWKGMAVQLTEVGECSVTPGDPSPAGRCPDCDMLTYVDTPPVTTAGLGSA